jgi:hypothetical protein
MTPSLVNYVDRVVPERATAPRCASTISYGAARSPYARAVEGLLQSADDMQI